MLNLDRLSIVDDKLKLSDLCVQVRDHITDDIAAAWDKARAMTSSFGAFAFGMEAAYAAMAAADDATKQIIAPILGRAAAICVTHGWPGGEIERSQAIVNACRRVLGEELTGEDPDIAYQFKPKPVPQVAPASPSGT